MQINTARLSLRAWELSDAAALYAIAQDRRIGDLAGWPAHRNVVESHEIIRQVFQQPNIFAVVMQDTQELVGCIGLLDAWQSNVELAPNEAEVAYWLAVAHWGKGLIPEALRALIQYAFVELDLQGLWCAYYAHNRQSYTVQHKLGFQQVKVQSSHNVALNADCEQHVSYLSRDVWQRRHAMIIPNL